MKFARYTSDDGTSDNMEMRDYASKSQEYSSFLG